MMGLGCKTRPPNCKAFTNGTFSYKARGRTILVTRYGAVQEESVISTKDTIRLSFNVKWPDECTYTLVPTNETIASYPKLSKNNLVTATITATAVDSYTISAVANSDNTPRIFEMAKIK